MNDKPNPKPGIRRRAESGQSGPIDDIFALLAERPEIVSFAVGSPDTDLLPTELLAELVDSAVARYGRSVLQYGITQGFGPMLDQADELLRTRRIACPSTGLHITTGGSGALHGACLALLSPGDVVLVESPTYGPAVKTFRSHGAIVTGVACDEFGIVPEALDKSLAQNTDAVVYLLPTFQNPTGRTVPLTRREEIASVILRHDVLVIEDDVYTDLRYRGEPVPTLWSLAPENTLYITSLSKTFAPAIRIGIVAMPSGLSNSILALKQTIDMQTSALCQAVAAEFLEGGYADTHLARLIDTYSRKLDILTDSLGKHFPQGFCWEKPDGGMFLWITGPPGFDADAILDDAIAEDVAFLPGSFFYADSGDNHHNTMRLSFVNVADDKIDEGIMRLATICRKGTAT